jgi:hypothetical protein
VVGTRFGTGIVHGKLEMPRRDDRRHQAKVQEARLPQTGFWGLRAVLPFAPKWRSYPTHPFVSARTCRARDQEDRARRQDYKATAQSYRQTHQAHSTTGRWQREAET